MLQERAGGEQAIIDTKDVTEERWRTRLYNVERENEILREKLHDKNRCSEPYSNAFYDSDDAMEILC